MGGGAAPQQPGHDAGSGELEDAIAMTTRAGGRVKTMKRFP
jgi:hypothetical protein